MEYRNLGRCGLKVSVLCLGSMQFGWTADETTSHEVLTAAYEAGIQFIDTADIYSRWVEGNPGGVAERIIGNWLKKGVARREQVVIATKVRGPMGEAPNDQGLSRHRILLAVEASLRRLGTDYIDLYQLHWPDDDTPIEETLRALDDLVHQGKVRYVGCSNFPAWRLMQALWTADRRGLTAFASLQPHYNLIHRAEYERELEAVCLEYGLGVMPYSPLAGGFLSGKYKRGEPPPQGSRGESSGRIKAYMEDSRSWAVLDALQQVARTHGATTSQVALAWLMQRKSVTSPIIGPRNLEQLRDNLGAVDLTLDPEERQRLSDAGAWQEA